MQIALLCQPIGESEARIVAGSTTAGSRSGKRGVIKKLLAQYFFCIRHMIFRARTKGIHIKSAGIKQCAGFLIQHTIVPDFATRQILLQLSYPYTDFIDKPGNKKSSVERVKIIVIMQIGNGSCYIL